MSATQSNYVGHEVIDTDMNTVGTITDVIYNDSETEPAWFVVNPGLFKAERYVPIERSYTDEDGNLVVPFDKQWIKRAPKAGDHILTGDVKADAEGHYHIGDHHH